MVFYYISGDESLQQSRSPLFDRHWSSQCWHTLRRKFHGMGSLLPSKGHRITDVHGGLRTSQVKTNNVSHHRVGFFNGWNFFCRYKKSVWGLVKGMIEKSCWQGLDDFFTSLTKALHAECEEAVYPAVKRKSRKRRRVHSLQRSGVEEVARSRLGTYRQNVLFMIQRCFSFS